MAYTGFINLGIERYQRAVEILKENTTGVFTNKQGFDPRLFDKWTPAMKKKIRRYWREYDHLTARPYDTYATRDTKKLKAVQKAALHQKYIGKFNKAFIPSDGVHKARIVIDPDNRVLIKVGRITKRTIPVDKVQLATDPDGVAQAVVESAPGAKIFRIQCGQYEYTQNSYTENTLLAQRIKRMQQKYGNWEDWLVGIVAYYFDTSKDMREYTITTEHNRQEQKAARRAKKSNLDYYRNKLHQAEYDIRRESSLKHPDERFLQKRINDRNKILKALKRK